MGEWSKKIGEYGENVIEDFLSIVGWNDLVKGKELHCINPVHLNQKGNSKQTHGIDYLYSYMNPLISGQLNNVIVSCKYKTEKYPNNPTSLFKNFMEDLITTMECFEGSEYMTSIASGYSCSVINNVGVLFWLNNQGESDDDLISKVSSSRIMDAEVNGVVYIVDNKRVAFILEVMKYIKTLSDQYEYSFYYPITGQNINPLNRENVGKFLPVEYLNSSIIPIKLVNKDNSKQTCLFLAASDNFEGSDLLRLIGLSKDITGDLIGQVKIAFPDYNKLTHLELVNLVKQKFQSAEFTKIVEVINYNNPLKVY
jgi:hypothetical protein